MDDFDRDTRDIAQKALTGVQTLRRDFDACKQLTKERSDHLKEQNGDIKDHVDREINRIEKQTNEKVSEIKDTIDDLRIDFRDSMGQLSKEQKTGFDNINKKIEIVDKWGMLKWLSVAGVAILILINLALQLSEKADHYRDKSYAQQKQSK